MRRLTGLLLACACTRGLQSGSLSVETADGGSPDAATISDSNDSGVADSGGPDSGVADAGLADAGTVDAGLGYSPVVGADGGEMSLVIAPEPGSSCASWMPESVEPVVLTLDTSPTRYYFWQGAITDGRGDLLLNIGTDCCDWFATPAGDGGVQIVGGGSGALPQRDRFIIQNLQQGPCLICSSSLSAWPDGGGVATGNGYPSSQNCSWTPRAEGDGAYVSCVGPTTTNAPPTFSRYDGALTQLWSIAGDGNTVVAADSNDRLLEANSGGQWRWVNESLAPLSGWFDGARGGAVALIGGGVLDSSLRYIPSGSAAVTAAPGWLAARPHFSKVLGGRAYALGANDCALEIREPSGTLCGTLTIENCRAPPSPGADGTITILENPFFVITPLWSGIGATTTATYVSWPGILR